ncbi:MAG: hypothetical protein ACOCUH_03880 [Bacteriovoracia bacterium]
MMQDRKWVDRFNEVMNNCQEEVKKITQIGKNMVSASQTSNNLKELYEQLGQTTESLVKTGQLDSDNETIVQLLEKIANCQEELKNIEEEVQRIKHAQPTESSH